MKLIVNTIVFIVPKIRPLAYAWIATPRDPSPEFKNAITQYPIPQPPPCAPIRVKRVERPPARRCQLWLSGSFRTSSFVLRTSGAVRRHGFRHPICHM